MTADAAYSLVLAATDNEELARNAQTQIALNSMPPIPKGRS